MERLLSKNPIANPTRRQSLRLKGINAIYESEDAALRLKLQQQTSKNGSPCVVNQVKVEKLLPEEGYSPHKSTHHFHDFTDSIYSKNYADKERNSDLDDQSIDCLTLKDLQTRLKAKKRKVLKSVAFPGVNPKSEKGDFNMKLKEEESDLEEPLISFKLKLSRVSSAEKRRRKHASNSSNAAQGSLLVERVSTMDRVAVDSAADLLEFKSSTESIEQNREVIAKRTFMELDGSPFSSATGMKSYPIDADGAGSVSNVKHQIMETSSLDGQNRKNAATSKPELIDKYDFLHRSFAEPFQEVSEGELGNREPICTTGKVHHSGGAGLAEMSTYNSSSSVSDSERTMQDNAELVYDFKSEVSETDPLVSENTLFIAVSSNLDFITKHDYPGNSCVEILERVDGGERESGKLITTSLHCCLDEASTKHMELDNHTCLSKSGEEYFGEISKINFPGMSSHQSFSLPASECKINFVDSGSSVLVSPIMDLGSDVHSSTDSVPQEYIHKNIANQTYYPAIDHSHESMEISNAAEFNTVSEDFRNLVNQEHSQQMPKCYHANDEANDHIILCKKIHDLSDASNSIIEVEHLNSLVQEAPADVGINGCERNRAIPSIGEHSRTGKYDMISTQHSHTCFNALNDSHAAEGSPSKTEVLSSSVVQLVNGYTDEATYCSTGISNLIDGEGLGEALHCHSQISSCSLSAISGLLHSDANLAKAAEKLSSPSANEKSYAAEDDLIYTLTAISHSVRTEGLDTEKELKCDIGMKSGDTPRKILSNRKTFSPASQEKYRQALNDDGLYDAIKHPGHEEDAAMLGPERMIKKPKSNRNGSLPSLTKGILKSSDASCRTSCSCTKSSSIQMQNQESIRFSSRQMHDFKSIAAKLLKGLNYMKNIIEETLCSETSYSAPSKFTAEEIRMAIEDASELEVTTNKWLSIMSKDCNRFCKIMRSTESKAASPTSDVCKERKKISFADEAGGRLCHVKFFDQQLASLVVSESDKADP